MQKLSAVKIRDSANTKTQSIEDGNIDSLNKAHVHDTANNQWLGSETAL